MKGEGVRPGNLVNGINFRNCLTDMQFFAFNSMFWLYYPLVQIQQYNLLFSFLFDITTIDCLAIYEMKVNIKASSLHC